MYTYYFKVTYIHPFTFNFFLLYNFIASLCIPIIHSNKITTIKIKNYQLFFLSLLKYYNYQNKNHHLLHHCKIFGKLGYFISLLNRDINIFINFHNLSSQSSFNFGTTITVSSKNSKIPDFYIYFTLVYTFSDSILMVTPLRDETSRIATYKLLTTSLQESSKLERYKKPPLSLPLCTHLERQYFSRRSSANKYTIEVGTTIIK